MNMARIDGRLCGAAATRQDLIYVTGLGTVRDSFTIGIHAQVESWE
jgi:hypothetical protein